MAQFTFLDMAGKTLFLRDDAERAQWTQEEMTLEAEFPRIADKVISIGQRIFFADPQTGKPQIYEVKQAKTLEPDHYQSIVAECICVSELSDEHTDAKEITDKTASDALASVLAGTLWTVGTVAVNPVSSVDVQRGSVWQAVLEIKTNWNVYIEPRVAISSSGAITRYLDILSTAGTWNGLRLSIDKNFLSPVVTYDDSEVVTALYGYGGTTVPTQQGEEQKEITFADVVWGKTDAHPAKPAGQTYLEDPAATAAFGRNGRARFGYYQNTNIDDPATLLQKTWEALQNSSKPAISIEGTVVDLRRMGYADEPLVLHDIALVEVLPAGYVDQLQIIRCTVDLLDPSQTTVTIGAYIPNIIYIERGQIESITGKRGGGGGGGNKSKQSERSEYETEILKNNRMIKLRAYQNDLDDLDNQVKLQEASITVEHNRITAEVADRRNADNELNGKITVEAGRITQEVTERKGDVLTLGSRITVEAGRITQEVTDRRNADASLDSRITQTANNITLEVNRATEAEGRLSGRISVNADNITAEVTRAKSSENSLSGRITVNADKVGLVVEEKDGQNVVKAASIVAGINDQSGSYVKIQANKINLSGYVTTSDLQATNATISNLMSGNTTASKIVTDDLRLPSAFYYHGNRYTEFYSSTEKKYLLGRS